MPVRSLLPVVLAILLAPAGCRPERDPSTPEGAFYTMIDAYDDGDSTKLWDMCTKRTQELVTEGFEGLQKLKGDIETHYPVADRAKALETAGVPLTRAVVSPAAFFHRVIRMEQLGMDAGMVYGAGVVEQKIDEEKGVATFSSRAGQTWTMLRDADGAWKTQHLEKLFADRVETVRKNLAAVQQFAARQAEHEVAVQARFDELAGNKKPEDEAAEKADGDPPAEPKTDKPKTRRRGRKRR